MTEAADRPIRVLLVDDHAVVRKGLRALFEHEPGIEVVGEAGDGGQAIQALDRLRPDVILMDLEMPGVGGVEATGRISERHPETKIVVLTSHAAEEDVFPALRAGALGYLLKHSTPDDVVRAIRQAHGGETVLHPAIARMVLQELNRPPQPRQPLTSDPLSGREIEVLRLLAEGKSSREIGEALFISHRTATTHVTNIFTKLDVDNRATAVAKAFQMGIL
jgi:two-component system, NarL family, response regulator LiaR